MVDGSRRQGPTLTMHMPPARAEPNPPRLIWDDRYFSSMCKHSPFQMDGLRNVAQCSCKGAQKVTSDHKSQDVPIPTWLANFGCEISRTARNFGPPNQQAHVAAVPVLTVLYRCGYFMAFSQVLTGTHYRLDLPRRWLRYDTMQALRPRGQTAKTRGNPIGSNRQPKYIVQLTRETGREMYKYVSSGTTGQPVRAPRLPPGATFKRPGDHKNLPSIAVSDRRVVRDEDPADQGAVARCHPNRSDHHRGHRRLVPSIGRPDIFRAAADFPAERYNAHIYVKETFALHEVLKLATTTHPGCLEGSTAVDDADNKAMRDACKKERSRNTQTHNLIRKLFWHQVEEGLTLERRWVCSEENWAADSLTRPEHTEHARLS